MDPAPDSAPLSLERLNQDFLLACKKNKFIKWLVEKGANPHCIDPETGCNGLHYVCQNANIERIEYLLECGLNINAQDNTGKTPLHYATKNNTINGLHAIQKLIYAGANTQIKDSDGKIPRDIATDNKIQECLGRGLDQKALDQELVRICQRENDSFEIFEKRVNEALAKGANINAQVTVDEACSQRTIGFTPLLYACDNCDIERVKFLIEKGADVNKKSDTGRFPLYVLFSSWTSEIDGSKRFTIAQMLLNNGADITLKGPNNNGLFAIIVSNGDIECIKLFKEKGIDIHCVNDLSHNALTQAVWSGNGRLDIISQLFEWGCKPISDRAGFSLLHDAVRQNKIEIVRYLTAKKGFNVNDCTDGEQTSLHLACENASLDMIQLVLNAGAKVNVFDKYRKTPLQLLSENQKLNENQSKELASLFMQKAKENNVQEKKNFHFELQTRTGKQSIKINYDENKRVEPQRQPIDPKKELFKLCGNGETHDFNTFKTKAEFLLAAGADINAELPHTEMASKDRILTSNKLFFTPLSYACAVGHVDKICFLLSKGAAVNHKTISGISALYALFCLPDAGSDDATTVKIINILLDNGADLSVKGPRNQTVFAKAACSKQKRVQSLKLLKEKGVDIHNIDDFGQNALTEAVCSNHTVGFVSMLFEWGIKPICDKEGFSLLHHAVTRSDTDMAQYLITEKGFNVNDCTNDRQTSLHLACEMAIPQMIELIRKAGANVNAKDKNKKTPRQLSTNNPLLKDTHINVSLPQNSQKKNEQKDIIVSSARAQDMQEVIEETVTDKKPNKKAKNNQKKDKKKKTNQEVEKKEKAGNKEKKKEKTVDVKEPTAKSKPEKDKKTLAVTLGEKLDKAKVVLEVAKAHIIGNQKESVFSRKNVDMMRSFAQVTAPSQVIQQRFVMPARETIIFDDHHLRIETQVDLRLRNMLGPIADNPLMNVPWSLHVQEKNSNPCDFFHNFSFKVDKELGLFVEKEELGDGTIQYAIRAKVETIYGNRYEGRFEYVIKKRRMRHRHFLPDKPKNNLLALTDK